MLPKLRPEQIFPRPCAEYTAHLGEHQAAAFTALWNLHDNPKTNAEAPARTGSGLLSGIYPAVIYRGGGW